METLGFSLLSAVVAVFLVVLYQRLARVARALVPPPSAAPVARIVSKADLYGTEPAAEHDEPGEPEVARKVHLGVVKARASDRCGDCAHFNLQVGQQQLNAANGAFRQVMQLQQPWEQGWQRNPAHIELERQIVERSRQREQLTREMQAAGAAGEGVAALALRIEEETQELARLQAELGKTPTHSVGGMSDPGVKATMNLTWADFGACLLRQQICSRTDTCKEFAPAAQDA